jgi:hypothetical protein
MSEEDADALGITKDRRTRSAYVRLDDAKQNYAAIGEARWHRQLVRLRSQRYTRLGLSILTATPQRPHW